MQREMLLLGQLGSSAEQELKLVGNIGERDWTPLVEELIELEVVFELLGIGRVDEVGRSLDISSHEEAADEFHIDLTLFLGRAYPGLRQYHEEFFVVLNRECVSPGVQ